MSLRVTKIRTCPESVSALFGLPELSHGDKDLRLESPCILISQARWARTREGLGFEIDDELVQVFFFFPFEG